MTCIKIKDGFVCVRGLVALETYGAKVWLEDHPYFGPVFYRSENAIAEIRVPSSKTWAAYEKWKEHCKTCIENAEKSTDAPACVQKTAELSDEEILNLGWDGGMAYIKAIRAIIAADRKLRGDT